MHRLFIAMLLAALPLSCIAASPVPSDSAAHTKITVAQLDQTLAAAQSRTDAELAQQLSKLELTERLTAPHLSRLNSSLPGEKSQQALLLLADESAFLDPPDGEIVGDPTPDAAATRQMLVQIVNYVNTTLRQLPNFIATRSTTGFEDRPQEDVLEATGVVGYSYLPLHAVAEFSATVTYRDHKEVVDEGGSKPVKHASQTGGLVTFGEFGPVLNWALADALKGKITWARWEQGAAGTIAVFHYAVPNDKSNYRVRFCCVVNGYDSSGLPEKAVFDERAAYHGEIAFNPSDGAILRIALEAEMPAGGLVPRAGIVVEYSPVEIGGKTYICPGKSISLLLAHTQVPQGAFSRSNYKGQPKTFLNHVAFGQYRRFGSETRILTGENDPRSK